MKNTSIDSPKGWVRRWGNYFRFNQATLDQKGQHPNLSLAKIRRQLEKQTDAGGCSPEWVLRRAESIFFTLAQHPDCGEGWYDQTVAVLNSARLVLAKLEDNHGREQE